MGWEVFVCLIINKKREWLGCFPQATEGINEDWQWWFREFQG